MPIGFVLNLAPWWPEESSLTMSRRAIKHLAKGCDVSGEVLELIMEMAVGAGRTQQF